MTLLVTDPLRWWAENIPDEPAIVFNGQNTVTYGELNRWTDCVAQLLVERGVRPGHRVGIVGVNSLEWCAGALGASKAGAIVAPYNHRLVANELRYLIANSDPSVLLVGADHRARIDEVKEQLF